MSYKDLREQVETLKSRLTPAFVEAAVRALLRQGEDVGSGVNMHRLIKHMRGALQMRDVEVVWAYDQYGLFKAVASGLVPAHEGLCYVI